MERFRFVSIRNVEAVIRNIRSFQVKPADTQQCFAAGGVKLAIRYGLQYFTLY